MPFLFAFLAKKEGVNFYDENFTIDNNGFTMIKYSKVISIVQI
jgi:hypothetical protein